MTQLFPLGSSSVHVNCVHRTSSILWRAIKGQNSCEPNQVTLSGIRMYRGYLLEIWFFPANRLDVEVDGRGPSELWLTAECRSRRCSSLPFHKQRTYKTAPG